MRESLSCRSSRRQRGRREGGVGAGGARGGQGGGLNLAEGLKYALLAGVAPFCGKIVLEFGMNFLYISKKLCNQRGAVTSGLHGTTQCCQQTVCYMYVCMCVCMCVRACACVCVRVCVVREPGYKLSKEVNKKTSLSNLRHKFLINQARFEEAKLLCHDALWAVVAHIRPECHNGALVAAIKPAGKVVSWQQWRQDECELMTLSWVVAGQWRQRCCVG